MHRAVPQSVFNMITAISVGLGGIDFAHDFPWIFAPFVGGQVNDQMGDIEGIIVYDTRGQNFNARDKLASNPTDKQGNLVILAISCFITFSVRRPIR